MPLNEHDTMQIAQALRKSFQESLNWAQQRAMNGIETSNPLRSSYFCTSFGNHLDPVVRHWVEGVNLTRHQIVVDNEGQTTGGEWLLDIVWTVDIIPDNLMNAGVPKKIICAVESESNTQCNEFFIDFSKLITIRSEVKIFLGGVNQHTIPGLQNYMNRRLEQAGNFIVEAEDMRNNTEWFIGFWPSPLMQNGDSLWNQLDHFPHLNSTSLYKFHYGQREFQLVPVTL